MQIQQPNIVGNFLNAYQSGLERQEAQKEAERQRMRQDRADQMAEQRFGMEMDEGELNMALRRGAAMNEILAGVDERNPQTLEIAKQRYLTTFGGKPEDVAQITMADIPRIKLQTGQTLKELELRLKQAQIGTEQDRGRAARALASQRYAAASGGGGQMGSSGSFARSAQPPASQANPMTLGSSFMDELSPKAREDVVKRAASDFNADRKATDKELIKARETLSTAKRFEKLLDSRDTGGMYGAPLIGGLISSVRSAADPVIAEMNAITAKLVPAMREPGSGSSSDSDIRMFERATLGLDKPTAANKAIAAGMKTAAQNMIDYGLFKQLWYQKNGVLLGAAEAWQQYLDNNTIFVAGSQEPVLNEERVPWRTYFGLSSTAAAPTSGGTAPQSGLQEGQRSRSKSGKPIVVRNGKWVFE
jgi:hypothetical protein